MKRPVCFKIHPADNVATVLQDVPAGTELQILGGLSVNLIRSVEPIPHGHKIALQSITIENPVIKFGVIIGRASVQIEPGQWVHLHNCRSQFDERSQTLNIHDGSTTDTRYE
ncbi:MAG: hypothetical protein KatS3mg104_1485 [Phycisphaerae bacterium]|jgi:hypothetical protein|nr:MAG: hypothetical protein KatS3mg104_1485 [Phycisphaerae bacterium]